MCVCVRVLLSLSDRTPHHVPTSHCHSLSHRLTRSQSNNTPALTHLCPPITIRTRTQTHSHAHSYTQSQSGTVTLNRGILLSVLHSLVALAQSLSFTPFPSHPLFPLSVGHSHWLTDILHPSVSLCVSLSSQETKALKETITPLTLSGCRRAAYSSATEGFSLAGRELSLVRVVARLAARSSSTSLLTLELEDHTACLTARMWNLGTDSAAFPHLWCVAQEWAQAVCLLVLAP